MKTKNYMLLCAAVTGAVILTVLYVPGVSDSFERALLTFLSVSAR